MPLLVRLTDSEIEMVDRMVPQAANAFADAFGIVEEIGPIGLAVHDEALLSDLHVDPVYGNAQLGRQLGRG